LRLGEVIEVMRPSSAVSDSKSRVATSAPGPPDALGVVERLGWHIGQKDRVEVAEIHSELKCCGAAQYVNLPFSELSLELASFFFVKLCGMFFNPKRAGKFRLV
jgi:hypothetical protein